MARLRKQQQAKHELKRTVRQYINIKLILMTKLIRTYQLPVYQQPNGTRVLYPHHLFKLYVKPVNVHLHFTYIDHQLSYRLQCSYNKQPLNLTEEKPAIAITSLPSTLALGMNLYFFEHLPATLLMPFTKKEMITIATKTIDKYIDNILLPIAHYYPSTVEGVDFEKIEYPCQPILFFEMPNSDTQWLRLGFKYNDKIFNVNPVKTKAKHLFTRITSDCIGLYYFYCHLPKAYHYINFLQHACFYPAIDPYFHV